MGVTLRHRHRPSVGTATAKTPRTDASARVEEAENWVETWADPATLNGQDCAEMRSCPAPHDGFPMGDANGDYDLIDGVVVHTTVVHPDWVIGKAPFSIPWLGRPWLLFDSLLAAGAVVAVGLAVSRS